MAPSFVVESLYCAEEVSDTTWDEEEQQPQQQLQVQQPAVVFLDFPVEDEEAISTLLAKEGQYMPEPDYTSRYFARELDGEARLECVRWIQKVNLAPFESEARPPIFAKNRRNSRIPF